MQSKIDYCEVKDKITQFYKNFIKEQKRAQKLKEHIEQMKT